MCEVRISIPPAAMCLTYYLLHLLWVALTTSPWQKTKEMNALLTRNYPALGNLAGWICGMARNFMRHQKCYALPHPDYYIHYYVWEEPHWSWCRGGRIAEFDPEWFWFPQWVWIRVIKVKALSMLALCLCCMCKLAPICASVSWFLGNATSRAWLEVSGLAT